MLVYISETVTAGYGQMTEDAFSRARARVSPVQQTDPSRQLWEHSEAEANQRNVNMGSECEVPPLQTFSC